MTCGIDVHTHYVPEAFPAYGGYSTDPVWPTMAPNGCGHANIMISGKLFRTVEESAWSAPRRIADMAEMGIERQVLSPMPELLSYWLPLDDASALLRHVNHSIAAFAADNPSRFIGMGAVPLQDVGAAIMMLRENVERLGMRAVEVGSNINGVPIGHPQFEPFFEAAEALNVAVFVHALRAAGQDRIVGPAFLEQIVCFPTETSLAVASLITSGMLVRFPGLRIGFSHGGGGLAMTLARMEHFWSVLERFRETLTEAPRQTARRAYYDLTVFDPLVVRFLVETFGASQLLLGSDYPFGGYEKAPIELLRSSGLSPSQIDAISRVNAARYLDLPK